MRQITKGRRSGIDLDLIRAALKGNDLHISMAIVKSVDIATDRSVMKADVELLPTQYEARIRVGFDYVAPNVGVYYPLKKDDLVLVAFPTGHHDDGILVKRLNSKVDTIPEEFENDKIVIKSESNQPVYVVSNTIKLGSKDSDENLVLGQVYKAMEAAVLAALAAHKHICSVPGFLSFVPDNAATYIAKAASPIADNKILSGKSFTEK